MEAPKLFGITLYTGMRVRLKNGQYGIIVLSPDILNIQEKSDQNENGIMLLYDKGKIIDGWMPIKESQQEYTPVELYDTTPFYCELFNTDTIKGKCLYKSDNIIIADRLVEFNKDSIKIGCTTVDKETINKIYNKINNLTI